MSKEEKSVTVAEFMQSLLSVLSEINANLKALNVMALTLEKLLKTQEEFFNHVKEKGVQTRAR